jgi:hypothetical protein
MNIKILNKQIKITNKERWGRQITAKMAGKIWEEL